LSSADKNSAASQGKIVAHSEQKIRFFCAAEKIFPPIAIECTNKN